MTTPKLAPCPFCGGAMQFRKALWPSDGCVDAVIHAGIHPEACGLQVFTTDTIDESVITAWNTRPSLSPAPEGVVERVARALFPAEWREIDRRRKAAQCYRETPYKEGGFESPEAAAKYATEYEAAADRSAEWAMGIAARGLKASGLDECIEALEPFAKVPLVYPRVSGQLVAELEHSTVKAGLPFTAEDVSRARAICAKAGR